MNTASYIGILAGLFSLAGYIPYAMKIMKGDAKPERYSWLIWTLSSTLVATSYYAVGARTTAWVPFAYVIGSAAITAMAFYYRGQLGWGLLEKISLGVALVSSIRWMFSSNALLVLLLNLGLSFVSYVRTIRILANDKNHQEDVSGWMLYFIGAALNLAIVPYWNPEIAALPLMFFIMNAITLSLTLRNRLHEVKNKPVSVSKEA